MSNTFNVDNVKAQREYDGTDNSIGSSLMKNVKSVVLFNKNVIDKRNK